VSVHCAEPAVSNQVGPTQRTNRWLCHWTLLGTGW